jgi:PHD/YefM family antitoxin component YafN of YafNO toxin-antitoxin module
MTAPKQFLTNEKGEKIAVVISIQEYEELLEELEDTEAIREYQEAKASGEVGVPFDEAN